MFKEFKKLWQKGNLFKASQDNVNQMFAINHQMFEAAVDALFKDIKASFDVKKEDDKLNILQADAHKKLLQHLSVSAKQDITFSLVLLRVTREAERVGDYAKNMYHLYESYGRLHQNGYYQDCQDLASKASELLTKTEKSFREDDTKMADDLVAKYHDGLAKEFEKLMNRLTTETDLSAKDIVVYTLFIRFLKRFCAHLANIATSVTNPFQKIGYTKEQLEDL